MGLRIVIQDDDGKVLGMVEGTLRGKEKPFSSGSAGYYFNGKVGLPSVVDGGNKPHQINCSMVEIGTKGRFEPKKKEE
jgi:hypothetical protein